MIGKSYFRFSVLDKMILKVFFIRTKALTDAKIIYLVPSVCSHESIMSVICITLIKVHTKI